LEPLFPEDTSLDKIRAFTKATIKDMISDGILQTDKGWVVVPPRTLYLYEINNLSKYKVLGKPIVAKV
jgi:hypothetical protein